MRPLALACALAVAGLGARPARAEPELLVDHVVLQVESSVITWSELVAEARLVLLERLEPGAALAAPLDEALLTSVLRMILHRELLLGEVRRLQLRDVPEAAIAPQVERLRQRAGGERGFTEFLRGAGFDPAEPRGLEGAPASLLSLLEARLEAARLQEARLRSAGRAVEGDVLACYDLHRDDVFRGLPFTAVRARIAARIAVERREAALAALLGELAARATIRFVAFDRFPLIDEAALEAEADGFRCPPPRGPPR